MNINHLNDIAKEIHQINKDKGFYDEERNIGELLALIHSEVSEALEADRNNNYDLRKPDCFQAELTDIIIRTLDLAAYIKETKRMDIDQMIRQKMATNRNRPHKHNKKY